jgi:signal transduction histidine kinase
MSRTVRTWVTFALCVAVALAALATVSGMVLALERKFRATEQRERMEQNIRLALWRMDSAIGPLIAQENSRPYAVYEPFYMVDGAYTRLYAPIEAGRVLIPSPLLAFESPLIRLHFQFDREGRLSSPQAPHGNALDLAEVRYLKHEQVRAAYALLDDLSHRVDRRVLLARLERGSNGTGSTLVSVPPLEMPRAPTTQPALAGKPDAASTAEFQQRAAYSRNFLRQQKQAANPAPVRPPLREDILQAVWLDDQQLLLVRRVNIDGQDMVQGCWLNWEALRKQLLREIADLMPDATLAPATDSTVAWQPRLLASLPVLLIPGQMPPPPVGWFWTMIRLSLVMIWISVLVAIAAVGVLLHGALVLGERRGAFVSAVTHELRTPLTTFRMYTEMLSEGMVAESSRDSYLRTLHQEAIRLGHLVENVLAYAKLEKSPTRQTQAMPAGTLVESVLPRLVQRAQQANMTLALQIGSEAGELRVWAEPAGVEQVLFNLVDNACKYAVKAQDRRIHVEVEPTPRWLNVRVLDHGPGIDARVRRRLFQPFSKSAYQAADSAPGVGLGLALSRRYARAMGGRLRLEHSAPGQTAFVLSLRRA